MKLISKIVIAFILIAIQIPVRADAPLSAEDPSLQMPAEVKPASTNWKPVDPEPYKKIIREVAESKGLPENKIKEIETVIQCESSWKTNAVGDGGNSFGLVQIHLPSHPTVTVEQAKDPHFAINFIVDKFLDNKERMWTCWRKNYVNI